MLEVMGLLNELEVMGSEIDGETQIFMAMETLSELFDQFKVNYSMNNLTYTLNELMKELQSCEAIMIKGKGKVKAELNLMKKRPSSSGSKGSAPKKKAKKNSWPSKKNDDEAGPSGPNDRKKDRCLYCKKKGHWKRDCAKYKADLAAGKINEKGSLFVTQACLVTNRSHSWIVDSGATNHDCCSLQGFKETRTLESSGFSFTWGNGAVVSAAAVGELVLNFTNNKIIILRDVYYVPGFGKNLISVSKLISQQ